MMLQFLFWIHDHLIRKNVLRGCIPSCFLEKKNNNKTHTGYYKDCTRSFGLTQAFWSLLKGNIFGCFNISERILSCIFLSGEDVIVSSVEDFYFHLTEENKSI